MDLHIEATVLKLGYPVFLQSFFLPLYQALHKTVSSMQRMYKLLL